MDSYTQALHNLESRLALALDSAQKAEHDLNSVRLRAGLPPVNLMLDSARVRRGEVVSVAEARRQRLSAGKDNRR